MDRRVTSPTWGPPPSCKQALKDPTTRRQTKTSKKKKQANKQDNKFTSASRFFVHFFAIVARLRRENA